MNIKNMLLLNDKLHVIIFYTGLLLTVAQSFPVTQVTLTNATFTALSQGPSNPTKDALASNVVLPGLRHYFQTNNILQVTPSDLGTLHATLPNEVVDSSCSHTVTAESPKITGSVKNSSYLKWGLTNISWHGATVFAETEVDSTMEVASDIQVKIGKSYKIPFSHHKHCLHLGQKTVGVDLNTNGKTGLGVNLTASNASIQKDPSGKGYDLVFNFHADVVGIVLSWDVTNVEASHCKIKILGITILSYCGFLEKMIKNGVNKLSESALKLAVPKLKAKLQAAINTKIGDIVRIPLKLSETSGEKPMTQIADAVQ
jgi:hypothetical protein